MTKEEFKAKVSMAYHGLYPDREEWEIFLEDMWLLHLQAAPRWISVEDELPKIETEVLMVSSGCTDTLCGYRCKDGKNGWYCYNDDDYWHNITHWMPLPQQPAKLSSLERTGKNCKE